MPTHTHWLGAVPGRSWDDTTILTTLFHLFALSRALPFYSVLVAVSTAASVAWHRNEGNRAILFVDYGLALGWGVVDAYLDWRTIPLNLLTLVAFTNIENHAAWHLISAAKATAVTHLLLAS